MFKRVFKWVLWIVVIAVFVQQSYAAPGVSVGKNVSNAVVYAPTPRHPAPGLSGAGIFVLRVNIKTGQVKEVEVARSTGARVLDEEAVRVLKQWRFKPGLLPPIKDFLPKLKDPHELEDSFVKVPVSFR